MPSVGEVAIRVNAYVDYDNDNSVSPPHYIGLEEWESNAVCAREQYTCPVHGDISDFIMRMWDNNGVPAGEALCPLCYWEFLSQNVSVVQLVVPEPEPEPEPIWEV